MNKKNKPKEMNKEIGVDQRLMMNALGMAMDGKACSEGLEETRRRARAWDRRESICRGLGRGKKKCGIGLGEARRLAAR